MALPGGVGNHREGPDFLILAISSCRYRHSLGNRLFRPHWRSLTTRMEPSDKEYAAYILCIPADLLADTALHSEA